MRKKILFSLLNILLFSTLTAQNLLSNGDFESGGVGVGFSINNTGYNFIPSATGSTSAGGLKTVRIYCASTGPSTQGSDYFTNFTITGGITNLNNTTTFSANGYGDFTAQIASQYLGSPVNFSMTSPGITNSSSFGIFVDWNQDGDFLDANESAFN